MKPHGVINQEWGARDSFSQHKGDWFMKVRRQHRFRRHFASPSAMQSIDLLARGIAADLRLARKVLRMRNARVGAVIKAALRQRRDEEAVLPR